MDSRPSINTPHQAQPAHTTRLTAPGRIKGCRSVHARSRRSTTRRVHQPHASYTRNNTTAVCVCAPLTRAASPQHELPTQPIPQGAQPRTTCMLRVTSAPAPSYVDHRASYSLQQLRGRACWSGESKAGSGAGPTAVLCVYNIPRCTAESSRGCGGNAHTSDLLDCIARNGGSGSQGHCHPTLRSL
jgi:hypothetical protein